MQQRKASETASLAAATRAGHLLYDDAPIFEDPFALHFTNQPWRTIIAVKPLKWFVVDVLLGSLSPARGQIVGRSRFAEDLLEKAILSGVRQYVIVGAGYDSFALRRPDLQSTVRVFELDHPDTQRAKIERIRALDIALPGNLEFVEIDFETATLADVLPDSTYQSAQPAFFSWLGTTLYLSKSATLDTLRAIAQIAAPGSELAFDYMVPEEILTESDRQFAKKLKRFTARRGEPLIGEFHPDDLEGALRDVGLELLENVSGEEQEKRYFANRRDGLRPTAASFFAHARVPQVSGS